MTAPSVAVFGNNVAALVSARELAERGASVHLIASGSASGRPFGGHFAGCRIGDHRFDPGMVLFEFTSFGADPRADIESYSYGVRSDVGRFASHVRGYIEELGIEVTQTLTPSMFVEGKILDDLIIGNQLSSLASLEEETRARIRKELAVCLEARSSRLHPRNRNLWSLDPGFDLRTVSLANHGATFHELFIEPLCRKLTGVGTGSLAAKFHRAAWLPLYYPETLCAELARIPHSHLLRHRRSRPGRRQSHRSDPHGQEAQSGRIGVSSLPGHDLLHLADGACEESGLDGDPQPLPPTLFHYPAGTGFHAVVERLEERVRSSAAIELVDDELARLEPSATGTKVQLKSGRLIEAARVVWSLAREPLLALKGHEPTGDDPAKASIGFVFVSVATGSVRRRLSTLHVVDDDPFFYRVTDQTANSGSASRTTRMIVEYNLDDCKRRSIHDHDAVQTQVRRGLEKLGILDREPRDLTMDIREAPGALVLPAPESVRRFEERNRRVQEEYPDVLFVGSAAPYGFGSLNDQIVQGMKVGRSLGR